MPPERSGGPELLPTVHGVCGTLERCLVLRVSGLRSGAVFVKAELRFGLALQVSGAGLAHYSLGL